jgi:hypothetical protein
MEHFWGRQEGFGFTFPTAKAKKRIAMNNNESYLKMWCPG